MIKPFQRSGFFRAGWWTAARPNGASWRSRGEFDTRWLMIELRDEPPTNPRPQTERATQARKKKDALTGPSSRGRRRRSPQRRARLGYCTVVACELERRSRDAARSRRSLALSRVGKMAMPDALSLGSSPLEARRERDHDALHETSAPRFSKRPFAGVCRACGARIARVFQGGGITRPRQKALRSRFMSRDYRRGRMRTDAMTDRAYSTRLDPPIGRPRSSAAALPVRPRNRAPLSVIGGNKFADSGKTVVHERDTFSRILGLLRQRNSLH